MLIFPTYQTMLAKAAATSSGGGSSIVDTDLYIHYDFSDTDCWNRNNSANAADYTVNNLANDYNDAVFRSRTGASDAYRDASDSPVLNFESSDGGGCLDVNPNNNEADEDDCALLIPGSLTNTSNSGYFLYNASTVSSTDSNNLFKDVGTGAFTVELWERYYCTNNDEWRSRTNLQFNSAVTDIGSTRWPFRWQVYGDTTTNNIYYHKFFNSNHPSPYTTHDIPGAPSSGAAWSDWCHIVYSRASDATNDSKLYLNNSLVETDTFDLTVSYMQSGEIFNIDRGINDTITRMRFGMGVFRFYRGKALTSSEVTTNWNAQKSRFGH